MGVDISKPLRRPAAWTPISFVFSGVAQLYLSTQIFCRMEVHVALKPRSPKCPWPLDSGIMKMKKTALTQRPVELGIVRNSIDFMAPHLLLESPETY